MENMRKGRMGREACCCPPPCVHRRRWFLYTASLHMVLGRTVGS